MDALFDPLKKDFSTYILARDTCALIKKVLLQKDFNSVKDLLILIRGIKKEMKRLCPLQFTVTNVIKKIQLIILEQVKDSNLQANSKQTTSRPSLMKRVSVISKDEEKMKEQTEHIFKVLKGEIIKNVDELIMEFENLSESINNYAKEHIGSNDLVLTFDYSTTILNFLVEASRHRNFGVIVVESPLNKNGSKMAKALADQKIKVSLITEPAVYAVMSRVNKIFIGAHAIMNNGGMLTETGGLLIAAAAKAYSVPFIVLSAMYKLTPKFPLEQSSFNEIFNPGEIIEWRDEFKEEFIEVLVDKYNYVGPEYISLYITDFGQHIPSHIYKLFSEYYGEEETQNLLKNLLKD